MSFEIEVEKLIGIEGNYSDNPGDEGGATIYGIDEATARANGYAGPMQSMPRATAVAIYQAVYWNAAGCNLVDTVHPQLADDLFEAGVNTGVETAGKMLQRALLVLRRDTFDAFTVDGNVGAITCAALKAFISKRGAEGMSVIRGMFLSLLSVHYILDAEANATQDQFEYGWQLNRVIGAP